MDLAFARSALERPVLLVPLALALLAAATAMLWSGVTAHDQVRAAAASAPAPLFSHVAANSAIARGQMIRSRDLRLVSGTHAPAYSLGSIGDAEAHVALTAIPAGAAILTGQISASAVTGIAARVPDGYRAFSVAVSEAEIAGGFLQAGDRVDITVTLPGALFADAQHGDRSRSTVLLQSVAVLAAGTKLESDGNPNTQMRTVTLALKADDLAKVALAARLGSLGFAIRNPVDTGALAQNQAALSALTGAMAPVPSHKAAASRGIPLLSGAMRTTVTVP